MASPPATAPIPGLHDSKAHEIWPVIIIFPIVAATTVALRLYTRIVLISNVAIDDWFSAVGLVFTIATCIASGYEIHFGMGRHFMTLTQADGEGSLKALFASILVYNIAIMFIKLSILLQYLRICTSSSVARACKSVIIFVTVYSILTCFLGIFTCWPVAFFWDQSIPGGKCMNESAIWFSNAGINIATDIVILILPLFVLRGLMMPIRTKIWLALILSLGGFACIASACRIHALYVTVHSIDITWDNPGTVTWSAIELSVGIICSCIGCLKPFGVRFFPGIFSSRNQSYESSYIYSTNHSQRPRKIPSTNRSETEDANVEMGDEEFNGWNRTKSLALEEGITRTDEVEIQSIRAAHVGMSKEDYKQYTQG